MSQIIQPDDQEDLVIYSLDEVCRHLVLDRQFVMSCVEYDVIRVEGSGSTAWNFTSAALPRIHKAWRLYRDLGIDPASVGLVLELLDERALLLEEVAMLRRRLGHWEMP